MNKAIIQHNGKFYKQNEEGSMNQSIELFSANLFEYR